MTQTITLTIWDKENKVAKKVKVSNVLNVDFCSKYFREIDFFADSIEIFILPELADIEFSFSENKEYVFITVKDCEEQ